MDFFEKEKNIDKMTEVLCRMNNEKTDKGMDTYQLILKNNLSELIEYALGTPIFNMKQLEIVEKHLLMEVNYYYSSRGWRQGTKNNTTDSAMDSLRQINIIDMFQGMKEYWEAYGKSINMDGVIFVYGSNLSEEWIQLFQKNSNYREESVYGEILLKSYFRANYLCGQFSNSYKTLIDNKREAIRTVNKVLKRIKLLSFYAERVDVLYKDALTGHYAGLGININIFKEQNNNEVKICIWGKRDECFTTFDSRQEEEMYNYFLKMKQDQRLVNLVEPPKNNFEEVMRLVGLDPYKITGLKHQQDVLESRQYLKMMMDGIYNYLETFGDWEHIEVEMGEIIASKSIDRIENHRYRTEDITLMVFEMKSNSYWYHIVVERQTNKIPDLQNIKMFMSDTNANEEVEKYIKSKLTDNTFH